MMSSNPLRMPQTLRLVLTTISVMVVLSMVVLSMALFSETTEASPVLQVARLGKRDAIQCGFIFGTIPCLDSLTCCYLYPDFGICLSECPEGAEGADD